MGQREGMRSPSTYTIQVRCDVSAGFDDGLVSSEPGDSAYDHDVPAPV